MQQTRRSLGYYISIVLAALPPVYLAWMINKYGVNVPDADHWDGVIPVIKKSFEGTLSLRDLWTQHNEHRIVFTRLVTIAVARLSHWNIRWEMAVSFALAVGIFGLLAYQLSRTASRLRLTGLHWALPIISLLVFSLAQYDNWLFGFQTQIFLGILSAFAAIVLLGEQPTSRLRFACAISAAIALSYSFGNGLLVWPIGVGLIILGRSTSDDEKVGRPVSRLLQTCVWTGIGAIVVWSYLYQYVSPPWHPERVMPLSSTYWNYFFTFVGSSALPGVARYWGIAGLVLVTGAIVIAWRLRIRVSALAPYLAMLVFAAGTGALGSSSRAALGIEQALASRYVTLSAQYWVQAVLLVTIIVAVARQRVTVSSALSALLTCTVVGTLVLLCTQVAFRSFVLGPADFVNCYEWRMTLRADLMRMYEHPNYPGDDQILSDTFPTFLDLPRNELPFLMEHRLSLFADSKRSATSRAGSPHDTRYRSADYGSGKRIER